MATLMAVPKRTCPLILVSCRPDKTAPKFVVGVLRIVGPVPAIDIKPTADSGFEDVFALNMSETASDCAENRFGLETHQLSHTTDDVDLSHR